MTISSFPGMQEVSDRICGAEHVLLGLDYDGTLTPIVDDPAHALLPTSMRQTLWALTQRDDVTVAVISGRAQGDLRELVGIPGIVYAGNHGMEISGPGLSYIEPAAKAATNELHALGQEIARRLRPVHGAFVEDKGLTLSVHHRRVAPVDSEEVWRAVHGVVAPQRDRFHVTLGDKVFEVRPLVRWNKGSALSWIKTQISAPDPLVIYIGDDTTDEDVFRILGETAVTIRVGKNAPTAARHHFPEPAAVHPFLHWVSELRGD
jgi:trehalose 6-phosphate phosphatase